MLEFQEAYEKAKEKNIGVIERENSISYDYLKVREKNIGVIEHENIISDG